MNILKPVLIIRRLFVTSLMLTVLIWSPHSFAQESESATNVLTVLSSTLSPIKKIERYQQHKLELQAITSDQDRSKAYHWLGQSYYQIGDANQAEAMMLKALAIEKTIANSERRSSKINNDLGLVAIVRKDLPKALSFFREAYRFSDSINDTQGRAISATNVAKTLLDQDDLASVEDILKQITTDLNNLPPNNGMANSWLSLGQLYRKAVKQTAIPESGRLDALDAYTKAKTLAEIDQDKAAQAFAYGYLGELYEDENKLVEALNYTRQALFYSQELADDTLLYRWQWQSARLLKAQGETDAALNLYRQAVVTLNRSRTQLTLGSGINFKQSVGPVFYEFADLLLKQSSSLDSEQDQQKALEEVIAVLEAVKLAEVEDYFDSECVLLPEQEIKLTDINTDSAIIYPVLLQDRTELIVQLPTGIKQYTSKVSASELRSTVDGFRSAIEGRSSTEAYLAPAQRLYSWLIAPFAKDLQEQEVSTIVLVPDGPLRSIPISALHDGKQFLIEKYAVATTPGITLTDPKPFNRDNIKVLASGLTEAVQGYSALPSVVKELKNIQTVFNTTMYKDNSYQLDIVESEMTGGKYNIIHFATHGEFSSDHNKSFLLTYDDKLTMNKLESTIGLRRFQTEPIDLLVLSACQTAVGDDQAALGLAGVAIKAGARSALATLWYIDDNATSQLIADFYKQLSQEDQTKAKALQMAQVNMITQTSLTHPRFWAPFLMIGNWL
tara:strand:- start:26518 stop:28698 length:2181 start_codon:yes stop_codon:yes gene_type:complete